MTDTSSNFRNMLEMIRFSHTLFALPFALLAAVMAWLVPLPDAVTRDMAVPAAQAFRWRDLCGILLCMVFARSAAMAFNRLADRKLDAENPRTARRHLVTGRLSVGSVTLFTGICIAGFVLSTLLFWPNRLPLWLSVPVLGFLFGYSYSKRFTLWSHFWLGAGLMLAPICTWVALRGELMLAHPADILPALILALTVLLWVGGFDIIYACQDAIHDRQAKLHSIPARCGIAGALRIAAICHFAMVMMLVLLPTLNPQLQLGWIYGTGVVAVAALLLYEHWLVRPDDLQRVNVAFFHVNALISLGMLLTVTVDLLI